MVVFLTTGKFEGIWKLEGGEALLLCEYFRTFRKILFPSILRSSSLLDLEDEDRGMFRTSGNIGSLRQLCFPEDFYIQQQWCKNRKLQSVTYFVAKSRERNTLQYSYEHLVPIPDYTVTQARKPITTAVQIKGA